MYYPTFKKSFLMKNLYKSSSHVFNVSHLTPPQLFDSQCFGNFIFKNNFVSAIKKKALLPILLLVVTLFCSNILNAQTYNLNWGSTSWVGPTYSKTVTNIGGSGIDATVVITNTSPASSSSRQKPVYTSCSSNYWRVILKGIIGCCTRRSDGKKEVSRVPRRKAPSTYKGNNSMSKSAGWKSRKARNTKEIRKPPR